ncbi:hypothetical protein LTR53_018607, partial [Teratosphaeriaceae sp. CCFEE 6253]
MASANIQQTTAGDARKKKATTSNGMDSFPFFDLPPELRNRIYRMVLVSKHPIQISRHRAKNDGSPHPSEHCSLGKLKCGECRRLNSMRTFYVKGKTLTRAGKKTRKLVLKPVASGAFIRINRQAHDEAAAILYAENAFAVSLGYAFEMFCWKIGDHGALLENIEVRHGSHGAWSALGMFTALHPA